MTGDNWPDVTFPFLDINMWYWLFISFYTCFFPVVMVSVLCGVFSSIFGDFYANELEYVLELDGGIYCPVIRKCLEDPILGVDRVKLILDTYFEGGWEAVQNCKQIDKLLEDDDEELELKKLQKAVSEQEFDMESDNGEDGVKPEDPANLLPLYVQIKNNLVYAILTTVIDIIIAVLPILQLDGFDSKSPRVDYYFISELLNSYMVADVILRMQYCPQEK